MARVPRILPTATLVAILGLVGGVIGVVALVGDGDGDASSETSGPPACAVDRVDGQASPQGGPLQSEAVIVYSMGEDVYTIGAEANSSRKLFSSEVWDVSPDGTKVAYMELTGRSPAPARICVVTLVNGEGRTPLIEGRYVLERWVGSGQFLWVRGGGEPGDNLLQYRPGGTAEPTAVSGWISITLKDELVYRDCRSPSGECVVTVRALLSGAERTVPGDPASLRPGTCHASGGTCWSQDYRVRRTLTMKMTIR